jgi:hypothetical protein
MQFDLHNKKFKSLDNSKNGEVGSDTIFHYRQEGNNIWATYSGGKIKVGTLIGEIKNNEITLIYQHLNEDGDFLTGCCDTKILVVNDKIRLDEKWRWTCKDFSKGTSLLEEI